MAEAVQRQTRARRHTCTCERAHPRTHQKQILSGPICVPVRFLEECCRQEERRSHRARPGATRSRSQPHSRTGASTRARTLASERRLTAFPG